MSKRFRKAVRNFSKWPRIFMGCSFCVGCSSKIKRVKLSRYHHSRSRGRGYNLLILDLGTTWGWVVSVKLRPRFTPGKEPLIPIGKKAGWASHLVWTLRLEEKAFASAGDRTISSSIYSDTTRTELPQLRLGSGCSSGTIVLIVGVVNLNGMLSLHKLAFKIVFMWIFVSS
jgi:hypothetical protein